LESGLLKRVLLARRQAGERLQRIAKKILIRKYFSKKNPRLLPVKSEAKPEMVKAPPAPRRKLITKAKEPKIKPEVQKI